MTFDMTLTLSLFHIFMRNVNLIYVCMSPTNDHLIAATIFNQKKIMQTAICNCI